MNSVDILEISGAQLDSTEIATVPTWNTVGYPSMGEQSIENVLNGLDYEVVWTIIEGSWKSSDSGIDPITTMIPGQGYILATKTGGSYTVNC